MEPRHQSSATSTTLWSISVMFILGSLLIVASCSDSDSCSEGDIQGCDLSGGRIGMQLCSDSGSWWNCNPSTHILSSEELAILSVYQSWASALRSHNYSTALSYTVAGSNAEGITETAKQQWDSGLEFYYQFPCREIYYETETELVSSSSSSVAVTGNWTLDQGAGGIQEGGFLSSAVKQGGQWKIDGFNSNMGQNWFFSPMRDSDISACPNCSTDCGPSPDAWRY